MVLNDYFGKVPMLGEFNNMNNAPKKQRPAWFWLLGCFGGVISLLFAAFCLVVDDINGGPNEKSIFFWMFEGFFALLGLFLVTFSLSSLARRRNPN
jgi:hypothetical protein